MISAELVNRAVSVTIQGAQFWLSEAEVRKLRAEINRTLQQIAERR